MRDHELDPDDPRLDATAHVRIGRGVLAALTMAAPTWWLIAHLLAR